MGDYTLLATGGFDTANTGANGNKDVKPASSSDDLKAAPWGMGWLLSTGALPDAKSFYCPSGSGADVEYAAADWNYTGPAPGGSFAASSTAPAHTPATATATDPTPCANGSLPGRRRRAP